MYKNIRVQGYKNKGIKNMNKFSKWIIAIILIVTGITMASASPNTEANIVGTAGDNGWYTSPDVTVTLTATDDVSTIDHTDYRIYSSGVWGS